MIVPLQKDEALLADIEARKNQPGLRAWWLGQSGFLLQWEGHHLLLDPYLSDSLTNKYAATDKPHTRLSERVIAPDKLGFVDAVTSSHNHTDHLDAETLLPLLGANPQLPVVISEANRAFAAGRLGCPPEQPLGLVSGVPLQVGVWEIEAIPSAHNELDADEAGNYRCIGFLVRVGPYRVYHSGDTLLYPGLQERLAAEKLDLAFLPINGNLPERRVSGNLDGREAAVLAQAAYIGLVVPHHYDMFAFNTASPALFESTCQSLHQPYCTLQLGQCVEVAA